MFKKLRSIFQKRFRVTSAKRVRGNGRQAERIVWAVSPSRAAMQADPAGSGKIVKVTPMETVEDDHTGKYTVLYAVTDSNHITYVVTVEEL